MKKNMRLSGFKESLFDNPKFNPPANVKSTTVDKKKLFQALNYVHTGLKKLLDFGTVKESEENFFSKSFTVASSQLEPELFPQTCGYVCGFLQRNGVELKKMGTPKKTCGSEGCAYFYDDKVLKCTFGKIEWKIATLLKGNRDLFPVIDTDMEPKTKTYLILCYKLDTDKSASLSQLFNDASFLIYDWFDQGTIKWWGEKDDVEKFLDEKEFIKTFSYRKNANKSKDIFDMSLKMFKIVVAVYRKSGYFLSGDLHSGNIGYSSAGEPQLFDFGHPQKLGVGRVPPDYTSPAPKKKGFFNRLFGW